MFVPPPLYEMLSIVELSSWLDVNARENGKCIVLVDAYDKMDTLAWSCEILKQLTSSFTKDFILSKFVWPMLVELCKINPMSTFSIQPNRTKAKTNI